MVSMAASEPTCARRGRHGQEDSGAVGNSVTGKEQWSGASARKPRPVLPGLQQSAVRPAGQPASP